MRPPSGQPEKLAHRTVNRDPGSESDAGLTIVDVLQMLLRRKWMILVCTLVAASIAFLYARSLTPIYEASATLRIDQERASSLGLADLTGGQGGTSTDMPTEIAVITSDQVAISALNSLPDDTFKKFTGQTKSKLTISPNTEWLNPQQERAIGAFKAGLRVKQVGETQLLAISFRDPDPKLAATIVNHVLSAYIRQNFDSRYGSVTQVTAWLSEQLESLKTRAGEAQDRLADFQERNGILATDNSNTTTDTLKGLGDRLSTAQADRIVKEAQMRAAQNGNPAVLAALYPNPKLQALQTDQGNLYGQYAQLVTKFGPKYAPLVELKKQMQEIDEEIDRDVKMVQNRLWVEYAASKNTEDMLRAQYDEQSQRAYAMNREQSQLSVLQAEGNASRELYNTLQLKLQQAGINAGLNGVNTMQVDMARAPVAPVEPQKSLILSFGAALGFIVGVASVFLVEASVDHVQNAQQLASATGYRVLAAIPHIGKEKGRLEDALPGTITLSHPNSAESESYRRLRNLLLQAAGPGGLKTLMIDSAKPGEGRTTVTANYGIVVAQTGATVLLVDADLRQPSLHLPFSLENGTGLTESLRTANPAEFLKVPVSSLPNLKLLTAGQSVELPSEAMASTNFRGLLSQWEKDFDYIVVKGAPLLAVSDSLPLAGWADGVLLVARKEVTDLKGLDRVRDLLDQVGANVAGIIINDVSVSAEKYANYSE